MIKLNDRKNLIGKLSLAFLISLTVAGCQVENKNLISMPEKPYILKHDTKMLTFHYKGHANQLSEDEESVLLSPIKPSGPGKVSVHVTIPIKSTGLAKHRIKNIVRTLLVSGVKSKQIHKSNKVHAKGQTVELIFDTYRAIPPLCPNWSSVYGPSYDRGKTSNFGCSTAVNFLLMIEDPIILFKGEPAISRDAARDSLAIADHRLGKDRQRWLKVDKSESASSGSSSDSSGSK